MNSRDRGGKAMGELHLTLLLLLLSYLSSSTTFSSDLPSHGCYWSETCESKWVGGCGPGHVIVDQSNDCRGLCPESKHPPCLPFYTHFRCCKLEEPKITDRCTKCNKKVDYGEEYVCCTDCSDPYIISRDTKLGFCKTGAELAVQLKPHEVFKWVAGPWMKCSSPCDGVRYRDVGCYGSMEDTSIKHYPVDDSRCLGLEVPTREEPCNSGRCIDFNRGKSNPDKRGGMSAWVVSLLVILSIVAIGGLGFAAYTFYRRKTSTQNGFVYIMLEGYS